MSNMDINSSLERMNQLIYHGKNDSLNVKKNVSETVEYKVEGPDGKTYGVVRESQKYFIKEANQDGTEFNYIGGIGNRSENEYSSYNSAIRNLELKIRSLNEAKNNGKVFETCKPVEQAEYIIEATEDMRKDINRQREIMNGANKIMNEASSFIDKPKFKDPESFGTASDPKKQGAPFEKAPGEYKGDIDPVSSKKTPKNAGEPFEGEAKSQEEKFDIEKTTKAPKDAGAPFTTDAKDVLGNSVATQKPKGGKVFKVTESQMAEVRRIIRESYFEDDDKVEESYGQPDYDAMAGDDDLGTKGWGDDEKLKEDYGQPDYDLIAGDDDFGTKGWGQDEKQKMVKEITEAVLNAFGQHPTYQKAAFTTPPNTDSLLPGTKEWDDESVKGDKPYGSQIGDSAPFTNPVKQKVGEGQIGEDADAVMQGKTPQGLPNLGKEGDKAPFDKDPKQSDEKIANGTPESNGEKEPSKATLGKKGDTQPFDKKAETINKIAEAIINDLKKKNSLK